MTIAMLNNSDFNALNVENPVTNNLAPLPAPKYIET